MISSESSEDESTSSRVVVALKPKPESKQAEDATSLDVSDETQVEVEGSSAPLSLTSTDIKLLKMKRKDLTPLEIDNMKALKKQRKQEKKRTLKEEKAQVEAAQVAEERASKGRCYTTTIAVPASIIDNAQSKELKTYLAGQIARTAAIFQIDEIVIYDDQLSKTNKASGDVSQLGHRAVRSSSSGAAAGGANDAHVFLARILQYLETPQYLRKALFPVHQDLKFAGLLNPLECPHHMRLDEWSDYREGVVVPRPISKPMQSKSDAIASNGYVRGSWVNVGLRKDCFIEQAIHPGARLTVKLDGTTREHKKLLGKAVPPSEPREQTGTYWGYSVRYASSISQIWKESPFDKGYDLKVGISDQGTTSVDDVEFIFPPFRHALLVFGGLAGIEECVNADESLTITGEESHTLFDMWINTCPEKGTRRIRLEEDVLLSLAVLRPHILRNKISENRMNK